MSEEPAGSCPYEASTSRYEGAAGREYWRYQEQVGQLGGRLNLFKFTPYVHPNNSVVDFGCGGGFLLEHLQACQKVGVEVNPAARERATSAGVEVQPSLANIPDGWADVVISNHALEHVLEPFAVLNEMRRILKPGGRVVLWLPIDDWRLHRRPARSDPNGHLYTWTPLLIRNLLTEAGFESVHSEILTHAWPPRVERLEKHPVLFHSLGTAWAMLRKRRQLVATGIAPAP